MPNPTDAETYEEQARAARHLAENCHGDDARAMLEQIARNYEALARDARRKAGHTGG